MTITFTRQDGRRHVGFFLMFNPRVRAQKNYDRIRINFFSSERITKKNKKNQLPLPKRLNRSYSTITVLSEGGGKKQKKTPQTEEFKQYIK